MSDNILSYMRVQAKFKNVEMLGIVRGQRCNFLGFVL